MDEKIGRRINVTRVEQALPHTPAVIATACPYCSVMHGRRTRDGGQGDLDCDPRPRRTRGRGDDHRMSQPARACQISCVCSGPTPIGGGASRTMRLNRAAKPAPMSMPSMGSVWPRKCRVDGVPVIGGQVFPRKRHDFVFLGFHVLPMEFRVGVDRGQEAGEFLVASLLVARHAPVRASGSSPRLPDARFSGDRAAVSLPGGECAERETGTHPPSDDEALGKRIDVVDHRAEHVEIRTRRRDRGWREPDGACRAGLPPASGVRLESCGLPALLVLCRCS